MTEPTTVQALWRGVSSRCARCGERELFFRWVNIVERCPRCGHSFERGDGFWLGSIMINTAFTFAIFLVVFVGGMIATWPEVPWTSILIASLLLNAVFPVLFHPISRTLWVAVETAAHPLEPVEVVDAAAFGTEQWSIAGLEPGRQSGN